MDSIRVVAARRISEDSWLREDRFEEFRKGYEYASRSTMAIPALAKCTPEETYHAFAAILHGIKNAERLGL